MSMFNYGIEIDNPVEFDGRMFSICPDESVYHLLNGEGAFLGGGGADYLLIQELRKYQISPMLRVTQYEPEDEDIVHEDLVTKTQHSLSELMGDLRFKLIDVIVETDGQLYAVFEDTQTNSTVLSHKFHGFLAVEARYNGFSAKTYKFQSDAGEDSCSTYVIEIDSNFARCLLIRVPHDEKEKASVFVSEFRP